MHLFSRNKDCPFYGPTEEKTKRRLHREAFFRELSVADKSVIRMLRTGISGSFLPKWNRSLI